MSILIIALIVFFSWMLFAPIIYGFLLYIFTPMFCNKWMAVIFGGTFLNITSFLLVFTGLLIGLSLIPDRHDDSDAEKIAEHLAKLFPEKLFKHLKKH
jgi:hypothetical protein